MRESTQVTKQCEQCGESFNVPAYRSDKARFCSVICYHAHRWGSSGKCKNCGKPTSTKFCSPECQQDFWNKNDYHIRKKARIWERKREIIELLGGKCVECGNTDIRVLDIHHTDESRKHHHKNGYTWARRLKDWYANLDSLELMCANCHRIHTWEQQGYGVISSSDD